MSDNCGSNNNNNNNNNTNNNSNNFYYFNDPQYPKFTLKEGFHNQDSTEEIQEIQYNMIFCNQDEQLNEHYNESTNIFEPHPQSMFDDQFNNNILIQESIGNIQSAPFNGMQAVEQSQFSQEKAPLQLQVTSSMKFQETTSSTVISSQQEVYQVNDIIQKKEYIDYADSENQVTAMPSQQQSHQQFVQQNQYSHNLSLNSQPSHQQQIGPQNSQYENLSTNCSQSHSNFSYSNGYSDDCEQYYLQSAKNPQNLYFQYPAQPQQQQQLQQQQQHQQQMQQPLQQQVYPHNQYQQQNNYLNNSPQMIVRSSSQNYTQQPQHFQKQTQMVQQFQNSFNKQNLQPQQYNIVEISSIPENLQQIQKIIPSTQQQSNNVNQIIEKLETSPINDNQQVNSSISQYHLQEEEKKNQSSPKKFLFDNNSNKLKNFYKTLLKPLIENLKKIFKQKERNELVEFIKIAFPSSCNQKHFLLLFPNLQEIAVGEKTSIAHEFEKKQNFTEQQLKYLTEIRCKATEIFSDKFYNLTRIFKSHAASKNVEEFYYGCIFYAERQTQEQYNPMGKVFVKPEHKLSPVQSNLRQRLYQSQQQSNQMQLLNKQNQYFQQMQHRVIYYE